MAIRSNIKFQLLIPSLVFIALAVLLSSCEQEEISVINTNLQFDSPQYFYVDEPLQLTCQQGNYSRIVWEVSDGSVYEENAITHTFSKPGIYTITLVAYNNNVKVGSASNTVEVMYNHKTYYSDNAFYALRSYSINNKIILEGYINKNKTGQLAYLAVDDQLNIIDTLYDIEEFKNELYSVIEFNNNLFGVNIDNDGNTATFRLKSTASEQEISTNKFLNTEIFNYSNGFVYYYQNNSTDFLIEYYDESQNKLWTKTFEGENRTSDKYLFNINDKLFYLSFDNQFDSIYINKFRNISLGYAQLSYNLGCCAGQRQVLFAFTNEAENSIALGVYSMADNKTWLYSLDENCNLTIIKSFAGKFTDIPVQKLIDGSIITTNGNDLMKYNSKWDCISKKTFKTNDFGISKVGCNLYFVYENQPEGLRLSYVDKHLNEVTFE